LPVLFGRVQIGLECRATRKVRIHVALFARRGLELAKLGGQLFVTLSRPLRGVSDTSTFGNEIAQY
jgi:hypothetical protein